MKLRRIYLAIMILGLWTVAAVAAGPVASPEGVVALIKSHDLSIPTAKLLDAPHDFMAAAVAGADYVRFMQADITEDNAGNGDPGILLSVQGPYRTVGSQRKSSAGERNRGVPKRGQSFGQHETRGAQRGSGSPVRIGICRRRGRIGDRHRG